MLHLSYTEPHFTSRMNHYLMRKKRVHFLRRNFHCAILGSPIFAGNLFARDFTHHKILPNQWSLEKKKRTISYKGYRVFCRPFRPWMNWIWTCILVSISPLYRTWMAIITYGPRLTTPPKLIHIVFAARFAVGHHNRELVGSCMCSLSWLRTTDAGILSIRCTCRCHILFVNSSITCAHHKTHNLKPLICDSTEIMARRNNTRWFLDIRQTEHTHLAFNHRCECEIYNRRFSKFHSTS